MLDDITSRLGITVTSEADRKAYLLVLQSAEQTVQQVNALPDYISPFVEPVPCHDSKSGRRYSRPTKAENTYNAWSHITNLTAIHPDRSDLNGMRVVLKDNISVAGIPYTCGTFPQLAHPSGQYPIPEIDAPVVRRLLLAGAKVVGTSTCENYSCTPMSYTSANGPVDNPWLRGYNAGGSSSGNACLLGLKAARQAGRSGLENVKMDIDAALGGDQACSIRLPASYCGIYGLKPTHGLVPYTGIAGLHPMIDHCGPMANNVEDCAKLLSVIAGWDELDPRATPETPLYGQQRDYHQELVKFKQNLHSQGQSPTSGLRIGIVTESLDPTSTSAEVARIVETAAVKHFTQAGATVHHISVPMHLLGPAIWTAATRTHMASLAAGSRPPDLLSHPMPHWSPRWPMDQEMFDLLTPSNPAVVNITLTEPFLAARFPSAVQAKAHRHVFQLRQAYDSALQKYDILLTPTTPTVAPPLPDLQSEGKGGSTVMDKMLLAVGATTHCCPFNITGHPAMSVPCGWARAKNGDGWLPVGMQMVGRRYDDMTVLKAAAVFTAGGGGLGPRPQ